MAFWYLRTIRSAILEARNSATCGPRKTILHRLLPRSKDIQVSMHADAVRTRSVRRDGGFVQAAFEEITKPAASPGRASPNATCGPGGYNSTAPE
jgi:hypothetical protein